MTLIRKHRGSAHTRTSVEREDLAKQGSETLLHRPLADIRDPRRAASPRQMQRSRIPLSSPISDSFRLFFYQLSIRKNANTQKPDHPHSQLYPHAAIACLRWGVRYTARRMLRVTRLMWGPNAAGWRPLTGCQDTRVVSLPLPREGGGGRDRRRTSHRRQA